MNFSQHLLEFLKKQGTACIPHFGTFFLKNTSATLDESEKNILPPSTEITFDAHSAGNSSNFIHYLSAQQKITLLEAEIEIRKQVTFWNLKLEKENSLKIDNIGSFFLNDSKLSFIGEKTENISADFYGLEEINISSIKKVKKTAVGNNKSYQFVKSLYWVTPILISISGLTYFAITQPGILFGKFSFSGNIEKAPAKKVLKPILENDSVAIKSTSDSLKIDSLKSVNLSKIVPSK
jgi:hypothetical protein